MKKIDSLNTGRDYSKKIIGDNGPAPHVEILDLSKQAPNLYKLKVPIYCDAGSIPYVKWKELYSQLRKHKINVNKFTKLFGCQTMSGNGPYFYNVEEILDQMINKKKPNPLTWD